MRVLKTVGQRYGVQIVVLLAVIVFFTVQTNAFRGSSAAYATLEGLPLIGIAAAGLSVTMIAGELDLSIGSVAALSGVIAVKCAGLGLLPCLVIATLCGVVIGAVQGLLIGWLKINSLVLTVGTQILFSGAAWLLAGGAPISLTDLDETDVLLNRWGIFSPESIAALVVLAALGVFLARTKWGREVYAIGGARTEAIAAGVPVGRSLVTAFAVSGGCAALAGAVSDMKGGSADPTGFSSLLLTSVAACLIGGISLYGGKGDTANVLLGVLVLSVLTAGTAAEGAQSYVTDLFTGALLFVVLALDFVMLTLAARNRLRRRIVSASQPDLALR